jgi:hypothetical protein
VQDGRDQSILAARAPRRLPGGQDHLVEARRRRDATTTVGLAGADRFDKQAEAYKKATTSCKLAAPPRWIASIGWRAVTPTASPALLAGNPPILSSAPLVLAVPPTASTGHSSYLPPGR